MSVCTVIKRPAAAPTQLEVLIEMAGVYRAKESCSVYFLRSHGKAGSKEPGYTNVIVILSRLRLGNRENGEPE